VEVVPQYEYEVYYETKYYIESEVQHITTVVLIFFLTISVSCIQWRGVLGGYKYEELATDARSSFQLT